jgi:hypothetical protein
MPVSKKRKKAGKPVQRSASPAETSDAEHPHGPEGKPASKPGGGAGKPSNPFVAQQQGRRGALRGR